MSVITVVNLVMFLNYSINMKDLKFNDYYSAILDHIARIGQH